jgi:hypothetical protein
MRRTNHRCDDPSCRIDTGHVMAFDGSPAKAIVASRDLWGIRDKQTLTRRFAINAETMEIDSEMLERGLFEGSPSAWASFRHIVNNERDVAAFRFTSLGMLFAFAGSPGTMWVPQGAPNLIPAFAEPVRPRWEDDSWLPAELDHPDRLIPKLGDPGEGGL